MAKSVRLRQNDIVQCFRLLYEVLELRDDSLAWRGHAADRLCHLIDASVAHVGEEFLTNDLRTTRALGYVTIGLDAGGLRSLMEYNMAGGGPQAHPMFPAIYKNRCKSFCALRREMVSDDIWYSAPAINHYQRAANIDDTIHSRQPVPNEGWAHVFNMNRPWHATPFTQRECLLVDLFHRELARLWNKPRPADPIDTLSERQRQVVLCMRRGLNEKQIAIELNLSSSTIHTYVKLLYRRCGVRSRQELLEKLAAPRPNRPRLSFEEHAVDAWAKHHPKTAGEADA